MADQAINSPNGMRNAKRGTRHGDPMRWIEAHLAYTGDECIEWPFSKKADGYGQIVFRGRLWVASRVMAILAIGEPPTPQHQAAHNCNNGHLGCMNPRHLGWKTNTENQQDRLAAGTANRGERHNCAKLTEAQVREIKARLTRGERRAGISREFGVHWMTINDIRRGITWGWVE